eukprot:TRINITY_DN9559_c0_g1_i7.p1 TRINITY_DN9559_c0_g1~~TRINITY_DN9559_c0_g1_i7.p1  ORF type:complete len:234 (-),score=85.95 TRINITY_DN9559_c0_g1_i7:216-917(-)
MFRRYPDFRNQIADKRQAFQHVVRLEEHQQQQYQPPIIQQVQQPQPPPPQQPQVQHQPQPQQHHHQQQQQAQQHHQQQTQVVVATQDDYPVPLPTVTVHPSGTAIPSVPSHSTSQEEDQVIMEYTVDSVKMENVLGGGVTGDGSDPVDLVPDVRVHMNGKSADEMLALLEKEASLPKRKKQKKNLGRTPVEEKRIEILNREHKARMIRENELANYDDEIKRLKMEFLRSRKMI